MARTRHLIDYKLNLLTLAGGLIMFGCVPDNSTTDETGKQRDVAIHSDGGVSGGAFTLVTGFETTDSPSYTDGPLATGPNSGQNGWHIWNTMSNPPAPSGAGDTVSTLAVVVSMGNPGAGTQHMRIQNDFALADNASVGAISDLFAPSAAAECLISFDVYIAAAGDGQYNIRPRDTAGSNSVAANVVFAPNDMMLGESLIASGTTAPVEIAEKNVGNDPLRPDICVLEEDIFETLVFKCVGDWDPGTYRCFEVSVSPPIGAPPAEIEYRYGVRDGFGVCPLFHTDDELVAADNVDSLHVRHNNVQGGSGFMDIDNLWIEVNLIPGACCSGSSCSEATSDLCLIANGDVFLGAGTDCSGSPCATGRCCSNGNCSFTASGSCSGIFFGGYPSDICEINCCDQPTFGGDQCENLFLIPTIPVPGVANFNGVPSSSEPEDCPSLAPDIEYHWEAFTIATCANVEISYCCSGESSGVVRSPVTSYIIQDSGPSGGCPCDNATALFTPADTNQSFGGTLPDKCPDGNFDMRFVNLPPGTYYVPIFIEDNDPDSPGSGVVSTLDYQMQIETTACPIGGCCTGNVCSNTNEVACVAGGGNYLGDSISCTFSCSNGACCRPDGSCTDSTTFGSCVGAMQPTTYFGGTLCANANGGVCPPNNDRCAFATTLVDGTNPLNNIGALDDGAEDYCQISAITSDIWFNYTATCSGEVSISLCGFKPDFDSIMSVYTDTTCPVDSATRIACNDDFDCNNSGGPDNASWSEVAFEATMGQQFKVRIGSVQGSNESGAGEAIVSCAAPPGCTCTTQADCRNNLCPDDNACNHAFCLSGICVFTCERYGDVQPPGGNGQVNLDDILCLLAGFTNLASCPNADINPCGGNAIINLDDILSVLGAFAGANPCACVENCLPGGGNPPLCGSTQPFDGGGDANGGVAVGGCCNHNPDCQDGLFCSGVEICAFGVCADGPNPCPAGYCDEADDACTGGCCLVGSCQLLSQADCEAQQGIYQGDGIACPTIGPLGACCFAAVGCLVRTEEACSCQGGSFLGDGTSCPANDPDTDCLTNAVDNCDNDYNPLQDDMDLDGVGDECDNCPTKANPGQEDANGMCGGDACETSALFSHCDVPFTPAPGIDPVLLNPAYPHPLLGERVHAVLQLCNALMPIDRQALMGTGLQFQGGFSHHELIITATQSELSYLDNVLMTMKCLEGTVGEACAIDSECDTTPGSGDGDCGTHLPFVRAIFPLPVDCRIGPDLDDGLDHDVHVVFYDDVPSAVANQILLDHGATNILLGGTIQGTHIVNTWAARLTAAEISLLAGEEPVLSVSLAGVPEGLNDGSRLAIGVNTVQAPPFCAGLGCTGAAIVMAEIDTGWAAGDGTWGAAPFGGAHNGLTGSVTARDRLPLGPLPGPAAPAGCAGAIICDNPATACSECFYADHATHVAGTMMGSGFMNFGMRGMAPSAQNISYKFPYSALELACELTDSAVNYGARIANNSWGYPPPETRPGTYGAFTQSYDRLIRSRPSEAIVFAAGNSQCVRLTQPMPVPLPPIYTDPVCNPLPDSPPPAIDRPGASVRNRFFTVLGAGGQTAKNTLVIGAIDSGSPSAPGNFGKMTTFSSWGPTNDGRIKPDLVAAGSENGVQDCFALLPGESDTDPQITSTVCSGVTLSCPAFDIDNPDTCISVNGNVYGAKRGTSMAAPAVSGGIGLLMQQQGNIGLVPGDTPLDSDSIKALLVHTAIDLPVHFLDDENVFQFMKLVAPCPGGGAGTECWQVPTVIPGMVRDGPDYVNGWGLASISAAANKLINGNPPVILRPSGCPAGVAYAKLPFNSPLPIGGNPAGLGILGCATAAIWDWVGYITVPPGTTELRVTIAWDDVAAVPPPAGAVAPLLVNNLDLIATPGNGMGAAFMPTGLEYYSWRLDPSCPHLQAVRPAVPIGGPQYADNRNNVEQIIVDNPAAGGWRIVVQAAGLAMPPQQFSIIISMPPNFP